VKGHGLPTRLCEFSPGRVDDITDFPLINLPVYKFYSNMYEHRILLKEVCALFETRR
jgi:hypothetical protein